MMISEETGKSWRGISEEVSGHVEEVSVSAA